MSTPRLGFEVAFEWRGYSDQVVCWVERKGDEYLYVFPENASFHISSEGMINCFLHEESSMQMLRHLLLNQIIPRYLATIGRLVLHPSDRKMIVGNFQNVGQAIGEHLSLFRLQYPRVHERLAEVRAAVIEYI